MTGIDLVRWLSLGWHAVLAVGVLTYALVKYREIGGTAAALLSIACGLDIASSIAVRFLTRSALTLPPDASEIMFRLIDLGAIATTVTSSACVFFAFWSARHPPAAPPPPYGYQGQAPPFS